MFYLKGEISIVKEFIKYWIGKSDNTLFGLEMAILFKCCPTSSHPLSVKLSALFEELRQELNVRTLKVQLQLNLKKFLPFPQKWKGPGYVSRYNFVIGNKI